jgi:Ca2+-binding EF-hand superfamily protein
MKAAFNYFDKNGDGKIDRNEILIALKSIKPIIRGMPINDKEYEEILKRDVERLMAFADTDHSGYIEYSEFVKVSSFAC